MHSVLKQFFPDSFTKFTLKIEIYPWDLIPYSENYVTAEDLRGLLQEHDFNSHIIEMGYSKGEHVNTKIAVNGKITRNLSDIEDACLNYMQCNDCIISTYPADDATDYIQLYIMVPSSEWYNQNSLLARMNVVLQQINTFLKLDKKRTNISFIYQMQMD